jgi:nucleoside-diphosphate-sugar epimerase
MNLNDGRIFTEIAKALFLGKPLTIFGDGTQTLSLNYIDDTVASIVKVMQSDYSSPINIGNDNEISINQLVIECQRIYNSHFDSSQILSVVYTNIDKDVNKFRKPLLKLNRKILGDQHQTSLQDGLYNTLLHFSNTLTFN